VNAAFWLAVLLLSALDGLVTLRLVVLAPSAVAQFLSVHLSISLGAGYLCAARATFGGSERRYLAAFCATLVAVTPGLGVPGLLFLLRFGLVAVPPPVGVRFLAVRPKLPSSARLNAARAEPPPSIAEVRHLLGRGTLHSEAERFRAALRARALPTRAAVGLLRAALSDENDELRLFAFSYIDRVQSNLEARTTELEHSLALGAPINQSRLALALAEAHFEAAYLGLTEGSARRHSLEQARIHAQRASELSPHSAAAAWLLGRIQLTAGEPTSARDHFLRALSQRFPEGRVLPYLAECAFHMRDFPALRRYLRLAQPEPSLQKIVETWR
jgi:hypothetical protein